MTDTTQIESAGIEDVDEAKMLDDDSFRVGLLYDTYIWMACDDGGVPDADDPDGGPYMDGYIAGCPETLRERVRQAVDHRIELGDDQEDYQAWMNSLAHGVRAHLERRGRGECWRCNDGNKSHAG